MRIPGIVDVYQVGDQWIARSWPKPANQPNSALQLLWRKKFADAHHTVSAFRGQYLEAWKKIECPPGKMWIDIAITSLLKTPDLFPAFMSFWNTTITLYHAKNLFPWPEAEYFLVADLSVAEWMPYLIHAWPRRGSKWQDVMRWDDTGWICEKGKRPKKKWTLSYSDNATFIDTYNWDDTVNPPYWTLPVKDCPEGLTFVALYKYPATETTEAGWSLLFPPIYLSPQPWPP